MKIFLLIAAALIALLGAAMGGMWLLLLPLRLFGEPDPWALLIILPMLCISAIPLIIGFRHLRRRDAESAKGVAGMIGFLAWMTINTTLMQEHYAPLRDLPPESDEKLWSFAAFIAPILCGYLIYKLLLRFIARSFAPPPQTPDQHRS